MKILLVEDDDKLRLAMPFLIKAWGHSVATADCGETAVKCAASDAYDIILLDEQLPDTTGRKLAPVLREMTCDHSIWIIGLTGFVDDRQSFLNAGMDDVIQKPLKREQLDAVISTLTAEKSHHKPG